ncbi:MAG: hypothetical protein M1825_002997 [Sarcosagium campestre]|nr:MAG: hypothetical protein M1825_002997 [Sarcosagium campestre]
MYWPIGAPRIYAAERHEDGGEAAAADVRDSPWSSGRAESASQNTSPVEDRSSISASVDYPPSDPKISLPLTPDSRTPSTKTSPFIGNGHASQNGSASNLLSSEQRNGIVALQLSRNEQMFATITTSTITLWQTRPTVVLAVVRRSAHSLHTYGHNKALLLRPDSAILVVQTSSGFLITYSITADPNSQVYKQTFPDAPSGHNRRHSVGSTAVLGGGYDMSRSATEGGLVREVGLRFRMVIKVDAGIVQALALDDELVVATERPAAVQCIRWTPDSAKSQTSTELLSRMAWMSKKTCVVDMTHDRAMNLATWITSDGKAFAVRRVSPARDDGQSSKQLFKGYCFHHPADAGEFAVKAAINARFSLIAVGCANGTICVYSAKDYDGNIPLSHKLQLTVSSSSSGRIAFLRHSPDGYCLFAGFEKGWMTWSVFGKPGAGSFLSDRALLDKSAEGWLVGVRDGAWLGRGSEILLVGQQDDRLWILEMARSAVTGCYSPANISRSLLQTDSAIMVYRGSDLSDLNSLSSESSLWQKVQIPSTYLSAQWPIRCAVTSPDGRYVAVAGRRGLAHYSVNSGRWKRFVDESMENEFVVRGGMCWHHHILIAAVESGDSYELRLFSRELALDSSRLVHIERLESPIVLIAPSGDDSLLVYTHDNVLCHYIITTAASSVHLVHVGQIELHGIIRSPARVRAVSWVVPDDQMQNGDPSQDVMVAVVFFLVDGKLVLLQPSATDDGKLRYEMRVLAHNVEYYVLMRDQLDSSVATSDTLEDTSKGDVGFANAANPHGHGLRDSLWIFDGSEMRLWPDVQDVLRSAPADAARSLPPIVQVPIDFYPLTILLSKGILLGVEPELVQRRDINFVFFKFATRTHLFLPPILRHHLSQYNSPAAIHLSHQYRHLQYLPHALEMLLHEVLDEEVDTAPSKENALLPTVISFLSSFPEYLDILVQCTRKTEVRSWRTLFSHLPPPQELFEESLERGLLKTAGGYLLVLHTFEELGSSPQELIRLLSRAKEAGEWELCKELSRFLMALDESGTTLRQALAKVDIRDQNGSATPRQPIVAWDGVQNTRSNGLGVDLGISD